MPERNVSRSRTRDTAMSIELIEWMGNIALAKISSRRFPDLLVQGDTLSILLAEPEEKCPDAAATETVRGWLNSYEKAMALHRLVLPYSRA